MKNDTEFVCYGCCEKVLHGGSLPPAWNWIKIFGDVHQFCRQCSGHFKYHPGADHPWDISPYMKEILRERHGPIFED